jgi:hypothetical protein
LAVEWYIDCGSLRIGALFVLEQQVHNGVNVWQMVIEEALETPEI